MIVQLKVFPRALFKQPEGVLARGVQIGGFIQPERGSSPGGSDKVIQSGVLSKGVSARGFQPEGFRQGVSARGGFSYWVSARGFNQGISDRGVKSKDV